MCLYIKNGPFTAKKDFYTIKVVEYPREKTVLSPYRGYRYTFNKVYKIKNLIIEELYGDRHINIGYHSLLVGQSSGWLNDFLWDGVVSTMPKGIVICKIPKGSIYYLGRDNDVVSDQIIITDVIATNYSTPTFSLEGDVEQQRWQSAHDGYESIAKYIKSIGLNIKPS